ncbi:chemotaxis protein CheW [Ornatilinea apprima]|uniref:Chemotaxis protein CheW n=1 Tax=Ornatilinea apprima TaxID=1134406 RepID=A0A0P6YA32_9CHLR|nr:chemotaxis protein CheW [Ornatilinea apprima]KPL78677.1 chemotaxis protein CheW [Ornatilinea apprima]
MEKQLVIFTLAGEQFGIDIASVESIIKLQRITSVPQAPDFVEGITNLRGAVLPVVNLERRFGLPAQPQTSETRIVVANIGGLKIGMIVASVSEVLNVEESLIEPPPPIATSINTEFIIGVAKFDSRLIILLDLSRVLTSDEQKLASQLV